MPGEIRAGLGNREYGNHPVEPEMQPANPNGPIRRLEDEIAAQEAEAARIEAELAADEQPEEDWDAALAGPAPGDEDEPWFPLPQMDLGYPAEAAEYNPFNYVVLSAHDLVELVTGGLLSNVEARRYLARMGVLDDAGDN